MPNFSLSYKRVKVLASMADPCRRQKGPQRPQTRRDPAQGPPDFAMKLRSGTAGQEGENAPGRGQQEQRVMKFFTGWLVAAGLVLVATAAQAQIRAPYEAGRSSYTPVSDVGGPNPGGPYAAMPSEAPRPGYGPTLLPSIEVYTVVRESGFSPLGIPHQRGFIYTIAVVGRGGDSGRLVIDARDGRVIRFMRGNWFGDNFNEDFSAIDG